MYNRTIDGTWADAVRAIQAEFGARNISAVFLVLPDGRDVVVTDRFTQAAILTVVECPSCGCCVGPDDARCHICAGHVDRPVAE